MYIIAYLMLVAAFLSAIFCAAAAAVQIWQKDVSILPWLERVGCGIAALVSAASLFLVFAFVANDYSLDYVVRYSDNYQHFFYRLTAFWAGQEGSLLFWAWGVALFGVFFLLSRPYSRLTAETKLWFWLLFLAQIAFFLLLLSGWSNPFITLGSPPPDGGGLNPLLQHPGMIFHPPLLFLGYGGFTIPACLALAQTLSGHANSEPAWSESARPFTLFSWALLSAGIILGAWWAYMELGWGGYWAWDAVENASLLPWLVATAFLHTSLAERRGGQFRRCNVLLASFTVLAAFIATYIVRSGALQSMHAYPAGSVGGPFLAFILIFFLVAVLTSALNDIKSKQLEDPLSREGVLALVSGLLLILAAVVLLATVWPLLSRVWSVAAEALKPDFYNRVCLPVFAILCLILAFCPWLGWGTPSRNGENRSIFTSRPAALLITLIFLLGVPLFWFVMEAPDQATLAGQANAAGLDPPHNLARQIGALLGGQPRYPLAQLGAAAALAALISLLALCLAQPRLLRLRGRLAAHGVHCGLLLMVLGIAFSGPYQADRTLTLRLGQTTSLGGYEFTLNDLSKGNASNYTFYEAELLLLQNGRDAGRLAPERRSYPKYGRDFVEKDTRFTLASEAGASLLAVDEARGTARLRLQVTPLINWIWLGGILLCLFPFLGLFRQPSRSAPAGRDR
ncbi:MAG: cytochrome c biogenesis protein CcsA [Deltaproteobacteria bacterium]|jgi:cytochrome c-type biogenesis protein CcmF|nr:cytochrome c biogenesis protein CcsA [Deltaproteobacteria bacterium]